jgi:hypothetical protein
VRLPSSLSEDQRIQLPPNSGIAGFVRPQDKFSKLPLTLQPLLPLFFRFCSGPPLYSADASA